MSLARLGPSEAPAPTEIAARVRPRPLQVDARLSSGAVVGSRGLGEVEPESGSTKSLLASAQGSKLRGGAAPDAGSAGAAGKAVVASEALGLSKALKTAPRGEEGVDEFDVFFEQTLSWSPRAILFKNFATHEECDAILRAAEPRMSKSHIAYKPVRALLPPRPLPASPPAATPRS